MFLMGGFYNERQHLEIVDSRVVHLEDLPFDFHGGRCECFRETQILACAPKSQPHECYEFELGDEDTSVSTTKSNHFKGGLVIHKGAPTIFREFVVLLSMIQISY